jgi:hypothetical protein
LKLNRKNVPKKVKDTKLKKEEMIAQHSGPVFVIKWSDKKHVSMILTYRGDETQTVSKTGNRR